MALKETPAAKVPEQFRILTVKYVGGIGALALKLVEEEAKAEPRQLPKHNRVAALLVLI